MKKFFLLSLLLIFTEVVFAQNTNSKNAEMQAYKSLLEQTSKTLVIDMSSFAMNYIGSFKDELVAWDGKITAVTIDENTRIISIKHNQLLDPREIEDVLKKYQISKSKIISHN